MRQFVTKLCAVALAAGLGGFGLQQAQAGEVSTNISVSETWTADEEWILKQPIYVTDGATLTIEPGTVIRGEPESSEGANDPGALIITRGSKIRALGTLSKPIVFTNLADDNIGSNRPTSGDYQDALSAMSVTGTWGGVILLGRTYVAKDTAAGPNPSREVQIEGLVAAGGLGLYGGCDVFTPSIFPDCDNDDSGTMSYVSIRYGGFNLSEANEINGLTLGAVGRETDLEFIEIFQNKDDGVELFGGTVGIKNFVIANVGDDSVDYDEGWRGKGQFVFVMQGTPGTDKSDKGGEHDGGGSPDSSQPFAIPAIYNATFVGLGQKDFTGKSGNTALKFRDNAGGRYHNSYFLDFGGASVLMEGGSSTSTDPNTSGERAITPYTPDGTCSSSATPCTRNADCPSGETCEGFFLGPDSTYQLELKNNNFQCIGRQEDGDVVTTLGRGLTLPTLGVCATNATPPVPTTGTCLEDAECAGGEICLDSPRGYGGDETKLQHDNGMLFDPALGNAYAACVSPLQINELAREVILIGTVPDPVKLIDPRPAPGSPLTSTPVSPVPADGFYEAASYRGAFSETDNWAEGWTNMSRLGYFPLKPQVPVNGNITTSQTWTSENEYVLGQVIYVTNGATLTIEPGTVIRGEPESSEGANDPGTLVITRGSKIRALGTENEPIVFTNMADDNVGPYFGTPPYDNAANAQAITGTWGGVILLGRTYVAKDTAAGPNPDREVQIEGLVAAGGLGLYGGCSLFPELFPNCFDDESGAMRYVSIRYGGFNLSEANEINGLTLGAVGAETILDYIEVFQNKDDGVEWFGGTGSVKHLIVANVGDDSLDYDEGWRGKGQFIFVMQGTPGTDKSDKGGEHDGGGSPDSSQPFAIPAVYNATYVGLGQKDFTGSSGNTALKFRDNAGGRYYNSLFADWGGAAVLMEGGSSTSTDPNTSGERTITPYLIDGTCRDAGGAATGESCQKLSDCTPGTAAQCTIDGFFQGPISTYQLELEDNDFWCVGRQEDADVIALRGASTLPTQGLCATNTTPPVLTTGTCLEDAECAGGEICFDSPRGYGGDETKLQHDNGMLSTPALGNSYFACASPLPIRTLERNVIPIGTVPDSVKLIDPRPAPGSSLETTDRTPPADGFFEPAAYKGAFRTGDNWAAGWSTMARLGYFPQTGFSCSGATPLAVPDEVSDLSFESDQATLRWQRVPGFDMNLQTYDLLRSTTSSDFTGATFVAGNVDELWATDGTIPAAGQVFYYAVRAVNDCGTGSLGTYSDKTERPAP
jgi:hypothetical protein